MRREKTPTRVLIVDDSAAVRESLSQIVSAEPDLAVMATAADPYRAVERIRAEIPDVIVLDVEMPHMDGITFLKRIMSQRPIPVVLCSSLVSPNSRTLDAAIEAGAVEVICKPRLGVTGFLEESRIQICDAIRAASQARLMRQNRLRAEAKRSPDEVLPPPSGRAMARTTDRVVAIGASTGGTEAVGALLEALPPDCPPIVVVQHMPETFTGAFAKRLDGLTAITVREAASGDRLLRGQALIAPGGKHTLLTRRGAQYFVDVRDGPLVTRHRPSVDVLFRSVAQYAGSNSVGIILTGMGDDGTRGLKEMRAAGARTLGQDEATCVVYGMPRAAFEAGAIEQQLPLGKIPAALVRLADDQHP
jgi:two-component system, chemotaxis family, protein-glutamate methylesterase/glutaminase